MTRSQRLTLAFVVASALGITLVLAPWRETAAAVPPSVGPEDPLQLVQHTQVFSELSENQPLRLRVSGSFAEPAPGTEVKLFHASQRHYSGPVTESAVQRLVEAHRAEVLEHRLAQAASDRLRTSLSDFDTAIRDVSLLIDEEEQRTKAVLRDRPDRRVVIATRPREQDPAYADLLAARAALPGPQGVIWGDIQGQGEVHVIVRWSEWPGLHAMHQDRAYMIVERGNRVRSWIENAYREEGLALFTQ